MQFDISDKLYNDIKAYCELNNLGIERYIGDLLKEAFMKDKYGEKPNISKKPSPVKQEEKLEKPRLIETKAVENQNDTTEEVEDKQENLQVKEEIKEVKPKTTRRKLS